VNDLERSGSNPLAAPLTRRKALTRSLATAGALGLAPALYETAPALAAKRAAASGTLVYGVESPPSGFDPARWWNGLSWDGTLVVFDRLFTLSQTGGHVLPQLAMAVPKPTRGGTSYTIKLRSGVKFHHGRVLTSDDVKYSLERLAEPKEASEGLSLYNTLPIIGMADLQSGKTKTLKGVTAVDATTVRIDLERPESVLLYVLALPFAGIVPRDVAERLGPKKFNFAPVGTGPYKMENVDPAKSLSLVKNTEDWNTKRGSIKQIQWNIGVTPDLSLLRIQRGQQDMMSEPVPAQNLVQLRNDPKLKNQLLEVTVSNVNYFTLSLKHPALKNLKVRQAVAMAVDKQRFLRAVAGLGQVATGGLFSPRSPYYQGDIGYPHDPEKAKALLKQAGFEKGFDVTFWSGNFTPYKEMAQTVAQDLGQIGIRVTPKILVRDQWLAVVVKNPAGITNNEWELPYPHGSYVMDGGFTKAALKSQCCNFSDYISPRFEKLVKQAHITSDPDKLVELYKEMDRIVIKDQALWVPMIYPKIAFLVSSRVEGFTVPSSPTASTHFFDQYRIK
jgi:ABC-type transport system substrate-binding protein